MRSPGTAKCNRVLRVAYNLILRPTRRLHREVSESSHLQNWTACGSKSLRSMGIPNACNCKFFLLVPKMEKGAIQVDSPPPFGPACRRKAEPCSLDVLD